MTTQAVTLRSSAWWAQTRYAFRAYVQAPMTWFRRVALGREPYWQQYFWNRWGYVKTAGVTNGVTLWFDAQALGELNQLRSLLPVLKSRNAALRMMLSTEEPSVIRSARGLPLDELFDNPWDLRGPSRRVIHKLHPTALIVVEHPKNPVRLKEAQRLGVKTLLISGFFSKGWDQMPFMKRPLSQNIFRYFDRIAAKSASDRDQMIAHGASGSSIDLVGDLKYDLASIEAAGRHSGLLQEQFSFKPGQRLLVVGSGHLNEVDWVLRAWTSARAQGVPLQLVWVPRWPEQGDAFEAAFQRSGVQVFRRSTHQGAVPKDTVLLIDTYGELPAWYKLAWVTFLGGSALPATQEWNGLCHSPLEALVFGKPVLMGPNSTVRGPICDEVTAVWSALAVASPEAFTKTVQKLHNEPAQIDQLAPALRALAERQGDVVARYVHWIEEQAGCVS